MVERKGCKTVYWHLIRRILSTDLAQKLSTTEDRLFSVKRIDTADVLDQLLQEIYSRLSKTSLIATINSPSS